MWRIHRTSHYTLKLYYTVYYSFITRLLNVTLVALPLQRNHYLNLLCKKYQVNRDGTIENLPLSAVMDKWWLLNWKSKSQHKKSKVELSWEWLWRSKKVNWSTRIWVQNAAFFIRPATLGCLVGHALGCAEKIPRLKAGNYDNFYYIWSLSVSFFEYLGTLNQKTINLTGKPENHSKSDQYRLFWLKSKVSQW